MRTAQTRGWSLKLTMLSGRRFAVGIDIQPQGVRAVAMSRALRGCEDPCIEHIGLADLPAQAMHGVEIADASRVADAIVQALGAFYTPRIAASLRVAMAVAPSVSLVASVPHDPSPALARGRWGRLGPEALRLDLLEPAVRAHAETLSGIEHGALALDWWGGDPLDADADQLTMALASREHIDARIDAAAGAGLQLVAIDIESNAALRACRYDAMREIAADAPYAALWLAPQNSYLWMLCGARTIREWQMASYPDLAAVLGDALAACADAAQAYAPRTTFPLDSPDSPALIRGRLAGVFVAGDPQLLADAGFTIEAIGSALNCKGFEFDAACQCESRGPVALPDIRPAALAVAFGLALRGVRP